MDDANRETHGQQPSMTPQHAAQHRQQLIRDGYCHIPNVAPPELIDRIRTFSDRLADGLSDEEKELRRFQGSLINVHEHEEMVPLITLPAAIEVLAAMGYPNPKFFLGFIISKPPEVAPPLFWHQDGILWGEPISYTDTPVQVFLMYYLIDTNRDNGCLRVIPGSHRHRHRLHDLPPAHTDEIQSAGADHPALREDPDEVDVPVRAGDLVIGDARLLHSAHPNRSGRRRTVITLWFCPTFGDLPESLQAFYSKPRERPAHWSDAAWNTLAPVRTSYRGHAQAPSNNRIPDARLA